MQVYLAVTPGQLQEASRFTRSFVHMAYRIGPESTLLQKLRAGRALGAQTAFFQYPEVSDLLDRLFKPR